MCGASIDGASSIGRMHATTAQITAPSDKRQELARRDEVHVIVSVLMGEIICDNGWENKNGTIIFVAI